MPGPDLRPYTALITGACSGIGRALSEELARLGHALVLVSDRPEALQQLAAELGRRFAIATEVIVADLSLPDAAATLFDEVMRRGIEVEILVNNAGFLLFGEVADTDPARAAALLQLHVVTPSLLARHFAAPMRERRSGHLLFVSSVSAWQDFPGIALYGSSKRYLRSFAAALRSELEPWGVNVTLLAPGATATALYDGMAVDLALARRWRVMLDAGVVARVGLRGMFLRRAVVIPGVVAKLFAWLAALTPKWAIRLIRRRARWLSHPERLGADDRLVD